MSINVKLKRDHGRIISGVLLIVTVLVCDLAETSKDVSERRVNFAAPGLIGFKLDTVSPRTILPDEGESVRFSFSNPDFAEVTIRIFDISGMQVRKNLLRESEDVMIWNGRDEDNNVVSAGIYIYQIEAGGEVLNGTVVVAR